MTKGITQRGERSYRVKIELGRDPATGKRRFHLETVRGQPGEARTAVKKRAHARRIELLHQINTGDHVERATVTVETYVRS